MVICILYPRLFDKKGTKNKKVLEQRRGTVFSFFNMLNQSEIDYLLDLLIIHFEFKTTLTFEHMSDPQVNIFYYNLLLLLIK